MAKIKITKVPKIYSNWGEDIVRVSTIKTHGNIFGKEQIIETLAPLSDEGEALFAYFTEKLKELKK